MTLLELRRKLNLAWKIKVYAVTSPNDGVYVQVSRRAMHEALNQLPDSAKAGMFTAQMQRLLTGKHILYIG